MSASPAPRMPGPRPGVRCGTCLREIFDGLVVTSRVVRVLPDGSTEAKCRCKRWVTVPLRYVP